MSHKTVILHGNLSANKAVRLNSAILADAGFILNLYERSDETVVSDLATIQVARFDDPNLDSPFNIDYFALQKVRLISHLIIPSRFL
jgi:hypothetical protein